MYVTRPLSMYRNSPSTMSIQTPDAPFSGYVVITDEEAESQDSVCWGICKRKRVKKPPFPQDRVLTILHSSDNEHEETLSTTKVWLVPVLDRPLSSNRYYIIKAKGKHKGKAYKSSREDDIMNCCFKDILSDKTPKHFNLKDIYQQFKIHTHHTGGFFATSVAPDGVPPKFLRKKGWKLRVSNLHHPKLTEALGLDSSLRSTLPNFNFPIFKKRSEPVIVGRWYCPFTFIREKLYPRQQVKKSMFYSMTLEQWWEEIYACRNVNDENIDVVKVEVEMKREVFLVSGKEAVKEDGNENSGFIWFRVSFPYNNNDLSGKRGLRVGLSMAIVEKMRWVKEEGGWFEGEDEEREVKVEREEEIRSENGWRRFSCYVLVESFALRRMNGSLVWKCNFVHHHRIRCKWD